jgi:hypothetical protein
MALIQKIDLLANLKLLLQGFLPAINELTYFYLLQRARPGAKDLVNFIKNNSRIISAMPH